MVPKKKKKDDKVVKVRKNSKGIVKYKFKPPSPVALLKNKEKVLQMHRDKGILDMVVKGKSYEEIGDALGVPTKSAFDMVKVIISKYTKDFALELVEARELELMRLQALETILWRDADVHELKSAEGNVVLDGTTGLPVIVPGDRYAQKMLLDVINIRTKIMGTEAAQKLELSGKVETIRREYVGVDPDKL